MKRKREDPAEQVQSLRRLALAAQEKVPEIFDVSTGRVLRLKHPPRKEDLKELQREVEAWKAKTLAMERKMAHAPIDRFKKICSESEVFWSVDAFRAALFEYDALKNRLRARHLVRSDGSVRDDALEICSALRANLSPLLPFQEEEEVKEEEDEDEDEEPPSKKKKQKVQVILPSSPHSPLFANCDTGTKPAKVYVDLLKLTPEQSLYHGSPTLFDPPYITKSFDNRFSPLVGFPRYYATKTHGRGYLYEYKIRDDAFQKYGGIPDILFLCGRAFDVMKLYESEILAGIDAGDVRLHYYTANDVSGKNTAKDDETLSTACLKPELKGVLFPAHEKQLLLCGREVPNFLRLHKIYAVAKKGPTEFEVTEFDPQWDEPFPTLP